MLESLTGIGVYPLPAFRFSVNFVDAMLFTDTAFQSISGLTTTIQYKPLYQGGMNEQYYMLPEKIEHTPLVLKRGIANATSGLYQWITGIMQSDFNEAVIPKMLNVMLLDENGLPARVWQIDDALPTKWSVDEFNAQKNEVAIESIELTYTKAKRTL